jgi:hypothetical protein
MVQTEEKWMGTCGIYSNSEANQGIQKYGGSATIQARNQEMVHDTAN